MSRKVWAIWLLARIISVCNAVFYIEGIIRNNLFQIVFIPIIFCYT